MAKKIIYFTAGKTATTTEKAQIAILQALTLPGYSVSVRNGTESPLYGYGKEDCDITAGTVPTAYSAKPVYGSIDTARPLAFDIWPKTAGIVGTATNQLYPSKTTGADLSIVANAAVASGVTYASSDETKAMVSAGGLVTGVAAGEATITATYTYATGKTITATSVITVS